jgi:hypothetical protein
LQDVPKRATGSDWKASNSFSKSWIALRVIDM